MALTDPVPSQAIDVFKRNMEDSDSFVNQTSGTVTNRVGKVMRPLPVVSNAIEASKSGFDAYIANAENDVDLKSQEVISQQQQLIDGINDTTKNLYPVVEFRFGVDSYSITARNQLGDTVTGEAYRYIGVTLPYAVTPATNPVGNPDFEQVVLTDHNNLTNRNDVGAHNALAISISQGGNVQNALQYVTPEMFGTVGAGANDNQLFLDAAATGLPIKAFGPLYRTNQLVINQSVDLEFSDRTVILGVQASGAKQACIKVQGGGLQGSAVSVTALPSTYLYNQVTVSDASQFAVGDTVMMRENTPDRLETGVSSPSLQDYDYYEFLTIAEISGSIITFEEFVGGKFNIANSITLQKAAFIDDANVRGGLYRGDGFVGGGVTFEWCRSSKLKVKAEGVGENIDLVQRMGGQAGMLRNCWECDMVIEKAKWTLFSAFVDNIQSCSVDVKGGKRTSNGGFIISNARQSDLKPSVQDNPGANNGDGFNVNGRTWGCNIGPMVMSGANCYTSWIRQSAENNTFLPITSMSGITAVCNLYGNKNNFMLIKSTGHPAAALVLEGNENTVNLDWEGSGIGLVIYPNTHGNIIRGKSKSIDNHDVLIGGEITNTTIEMECLGNGLLLGSGVFENWSNRINITGTNPKFIGLSNTGRGYTFTWQPEAAIGDTPVDLLVPGDSAGVNGLKNITPTAADDGDIYYIKLKTNTLIDDTYSEYRVMTRGNIWQVEAAVEGASVFAPRLVATGTNPIKISLNGAGTSLKISYTVEKV